MRFEPIRLGMVEDAFGNGRLFMSTNKRLLEELRLERPSVASASHGSRKKVLAASALVCACIVAVLVGVHLLLRPKIVAPAQKETAVPVRGEVQPASSIVQTANPSSSVLQASGYVVARRMATVSARVTGRVAEVLIEEGQHVSKGQVLARLDRIDADANRRLYIARAAAARAQVRQYKAELGQAIVEEARLRTLVEQKLVSRSQYDQAVAQRDALQAQLESEEMEVATALEQVRIADIGISDTIVRAPFDGVVVAKAAQPGEIVSPLSAGGSYTRTGIGTIVDMASLEVEVDVGEAYISRVQPGMPVSITLNAYRDSPFPGKVIAIIPTADRGKATVKVRVGFLAPDERIVPEMGAMVSFSARREANAADNQGSM
ncbi:efflux RND transporter periplasmic adaptor subunit [[Pseudomonas] boreopolis]|uniref:efflux RND transporter periplasmic adaptor subunit n=1 Tax=Xanthomonas boreopolis TaxID=86183 RepID=UPI003D579930